MSLLPSFLPLLSFFPFVAADWLLTRIGLVQPYYALHVVHNAIVVWMTAPDVVATFTDVHNLTAYPTNTAAAALVAAFHAYHVVRYWGKLNTDDWAHHGCMIGVAIPIGLFFGAGPLMGCSLFFATGLPGGLSYAILLAAWNGWLHRLTVKRWNSRIHTWLRAPGCLAHAAVTAAVTLSSNLTLAEKMMGLGPAALMAWNGAYFMEQVVSDHARRLAEARAWEHELMP
jgi:hypothetical protein